MSKYYILKVRGTWLSYNEFSVSAQGLDSAYCIGPDAELGMAITRNQYEAVRFTRRAVREVREGGFQGGAYHFVRLKTKGDKLMARARKALVYNPSDDSFVYVSESGNLDVCRAIESAIVIDVLAEAGF